MALIIIAFIIGEYSYDKAYPNINRIYRVFANNDRASVREDFREFFLEKYPAIEDACRYNNCGSILTYEDKPFTGQMIVTDTSFFNIFSTRFLVGSKHSSLTNPNDIVLTESFARKVFGNEDPTGKTLIAEYKSPLTVCGVVEDFPAFSSIKGDFFTNSKLKIKYEGWSDGMGNEVNYFRLFILVKNEYGISGLEELLNRDVKSIQYKAGLIRDKLLSDPTIRNVCFSHGSPGSIYSYSSWDLPGKPEDTMYELTTDTAFFNVFQIPLIRGRELLPSDFNKVCYINETAFKTAGWETFEGEKYHGLEIIGIVRDFHFADMYTQIKPLAIQISSEMGISHLTLRVTPDNIPRTINLLTQTWKEVCPGHDLSYQFYDEWLNSMYKSEERLAAAIRLFAILAIMISCLGIIGLAEFSIRKRIKEIGIRKVNGARIYEVMVLLNRNLVKWTVIAFVLAIPLAWYLMNLWLQNFAYRTRLSSWIFILAGLIALGIALLTVSWQSWRAASRNPVEALRYE
jgi:hypothetical protein